jgi:hypothetical protein
MIQNHLGNCSSHLYINNATNSSLSTVFHSFSHFFMSFIYFIVISALRAMPNRHCYVPGQMRKLSPQGRLNCPGSYKWEVGLDGAAEPEREPVFPFLV